MKKFFKALILLVCSSFLLSSCAPKTSDVRISEQDSIYLIVDELMHTLYYWKDNVTSVKFGDHSHPGEMMQEMRYNKYDKWSSVYERSIIEEFLTGETQSYGIALGWDTENNIRVSVVYKETEAYKAGIRRGDLIEKINGADPRFDNLDFFFAPRLGEEIELLVRKNNGTTLNVTISAQAVMIDDVLHSQIFNYGETKVGYIVYESFSTVSKRTLLNLMSDFKSDGVNELIIDLRYNGGGEVDVLLDWANYIIKAQFDDRTFMNITHNKNYSYEDVSHTLDIKSYSSLELDRVFVITSSATASASEALIKCFEPFLDVHTIGTKTHGKPVGMYLLEFHDWYLLPITFEYTNAYKDGGFFNGIEPEKYVIASPDADWGDLSDECLAEALHFINNGSYSANTYTSVFKSEHSQFPSKQLGLFVRK